MENGTIQALNVNGLEFEADMAKARTWGAFSHMRIIADETADDASRVNHMFSLIEYATNLDESAIVEHCGGGDAPFSDVFAMVSGIIAELYPKN